ncbi:hypothetical protein RHSIM_Rhsim02G0124700 [Rhododendron simsii]|uniref:Uncharacterized protein n=1 Tax=Rhododendron simsii TaxID=118357 RepID=A0A834LVJ8_RHOSS|nr:hypothetical protein RHSIM_Rhsim02G0124700 [Rhododendron simsii]
MLWICKGVSNYDLVCKVELWSHQVHESILTRSTTPVDSCDPNSTRLGLSTRGRLRGLGCWLRLGLGKSPSLLSGLTCPPHSGLSLSLSRQFYQFSDNSMCMTQYLSYPLFTVLQDGFSRRINSDRCQPLPYNAAGSHFVKESSWMQRFRCSEVSDQNFEDEDQEEKSLSLSRPKRLKMDAADSSTNDQVNT